MKCHQWIIATAILRLCQGTTELRADDETAETIKALKKQIEELDQRVRILDRKSELDKEASAELARSAPTMSSDGRGFTLQSADTNFVLKLRGLLQLDSRTYVNDGGIKNNDSFVLRRARPIIEGTVFRDFDFLFVPDFGTSASSSTATVPSILDVYLNYRYRPELQLRVGKFKTPVGLEQLQSDSQGYFIERGHPTQLTPNRDLGVQLHGEVAGGVFNYAVGVFNGVGDNRSSSNSDFDDEKAVAGRLFFHPFQRTDLASLKGLGLGAGASYGNSEGASGLPNNNGFFSDGVEQWFTYTTGAGTNANVTADGAHWRITPQGYWYYGPLGLLGEYVISAQKLRRASGPTATPTVDFLTARNTAWQIEAGWVLTGEDASYKGVSPKKNFDPHHGGWGAFELVGRYGVLDVDNDVFKGSRPFASAATSATKARAWGVGLNWYLNKNVRLALNYFQTDFAGGDKGSNPVTQRNEKAFLTRVQLAF